MSLKELQKQFLNYIYRNETMNSTAEDIISPSFQESMAIYRRHVWYTLIKTLEAHYISVRHLLGEEKFMNLAEKYITNNPSKTPDLECYGFSFPEFLKEQNIDSYIYDLSLLDLAYVKAAIAKDFDIKTIEEFQNINPENLEKVTFSVNPTSIICHLSYDVFDLFTDIKLDRYQARFEAEEKNNIIIVSRDSKNNISHHEMSKADILFLSLAKKGTGFYEIYEALEKSEMNFQKSLTKLIQGQYISSFTIN